MRFAAGVLLGLLLAGPTVEHHYHVTETNRLRLEREVIVNTPEVYEVTTYGDPDERAACVIELLGGPGGDWDADDAIDILERAHAAGVSPCEMEL